MRIRTYVCTYIHLYLRRFGCAWLYYGIVLLTTTIIQYEPHCGESHVPLTTVNRGIFVLNNFHAIIFCVKIFSYASRPYENFSTTKI